MHTRDYLVEESRDKKGVEFDVSGWSVSTPRDIPQQRNGSDCGVFTCMVSDIQTCILHVDMLYPFVYVLMLFWRVVY